MRRRIPPLASLESLDAVGRLGNVTRAAEELGRTQSAVSRQIASLESFARQPLFSRTNNRLSLNPAGRFLFEAVGQALDRLERATLRTMQFNAERRRIVLRVWPTFGARWLISRLARFPGAELGVEIDLTIWVEPQLDLRSLGVDAAILYGDGVWPGMDSHLLLPEHLIAVAAPSLVQRHGLRLEAYEWLHLRVRPEAWRTWMEARSKLTTVSKDAGRFEISMLIELVCSGAGATVLPTIYVENELATHRLAAPFGPPLATGRGYYLCFLQEERARPEIVAFRDWLLSTCGAEARPPS